MQPWHCHTDGGSRLPGADKLHKLGHKTCRDSPVSRIQRALMMLVETSEEFLRREKGRPELSDEALIDLEVREDEAQS